MKIEKAHISDAERISDLTKRSKNYWNYGEKQITAWAEDLTITPEYIAENSVYKLTNQEIIGYYALKSEKNETAKLDYLFVEPVYIGKGYGRILMNDFLHRMATMDFKKVTLDADPNAEGFYESYGFTVVGKLSSSIKDRFLPIMEKEI